MLMNWLLVILGPEIYSSARISSRDVVKKLKLN